MSDEKHRCPKCNSPDTVSYWSDKDEGKDSLPYTVIKAWYPNARRCVDCAAVWW